MSITNKVKNQITLIGDLYQSTDNKRIIGRIYSTQELGRNIVIK